MIYHYKMGTPQAVGGGGDGTKENPWYWYEKTEGQTISLNNTGTSSGDNCRLYIRVKLNAGTTYYIGETSPGDGDGKIWLYDQSGNALVDNDDDYADIAGIECSDHFEYTPSTTGIYIIGAGAYSSSQGSYTLAMQPAPASDPVPVPQIIIPTSQGFNTWGRAIKYRSAKIAGCSYDPIPQEGLVFYASLSGDTATAQSGQSLTKSGTITYQTVKGVPCAYFNGSARLVTSTSNTWNNVTLSAWLYTTNSGSYTSALHIGADSSNQMFKIGDLQGKPFVSRYSTVDAGADISLADSFHHVLATFDSSYVKLYVDGILKLNISNSGSIGSSIIVIGTDNNGSYAYTGYIAACRIYNRVLSQAQIQSLSSEFKPTA